MGNRAIIVSTGNMSDVTAGIYVHWFDKGTLENALEEMKARGYRDPADDAEYGMARLCQVLCEQNPDGLNIGLTTVDLDDPRCGLELIAADFCGVYQAVWSGNGWELEEYTEEDEDEDEEED
ncbi:TPA_asm: hypothetical protein vir335_00069 [Classicovirus victor]|uniref:Uncharacterized protein n=1 Tax=Caudoviricetes sp. vir335 TaxID=3068357 RepID=A0AA86YFH7_9CAUD|nr:TPA_asm: hypothetical protein vir335_00069 [Caudoviricetes sp. vir335]